MKQVIMVILCVVTMWVGDAFAVCSGTVTVATTPTADFVDHGNGVVTHTKTGLMWKQCSEGLSGVGCGTGTAASFTWAGALQQANTLNNAGGFAGFTDWRVPNVKELASILELQCSNNAINTTIFPDVPVTNFSITYLSSSRSRSGMVWVVSFDVADSHTPGSITTHKVRLVRGGP